MKAWLVQIKGWPEADCIVGGQTRGQARIKSFLAAREAGYQIAIGTIRATRAPQYDAWLETHPQSRCWDLQYIKWDIEAAQKGA